MEDETASMPAVEVLPLPESPDSKHEEIKKQKTKAERLLVSKEKKCLVVMLLKKPPNRIQVKRMGCIEA